MKTPRVLSLALWAILASGVIGLAIPTQAQTIPVPPAEYKPVDGEFDALGRAVVELFQSQSASNFVAKVVIRGTDYQSLITTNLAKSAVATLQKFTNGDNTRLVLPSVQVALKTVESLHLNADGSKLSFHVVPPKHVSAMYMGNPSASGNLSIPHLAELAIDLESGSQSNLTLTLRNVQKFPTGWRVGESISWTTLPTNAFDSKTLADLSLQNKVVSRKPITSDDDPSLLELSQTVIHFLRTLNTNDLRTNTFLDANTAFEMMTQLGKQLGQPLPSRKELDEHCASMLDDQIKASGKIVSTMKNSGIDLKAADIKIKSAGVQSCRSQGNLGTSLLRGERFELALSVSSDAHSSNGVSVAGEYVVGINQLLKFNGKWLIENDFRLAKLPTGVLDAKTVADMEFEEYVAKNHSIPAGIAAPEIEFTSLADGKTLKLSEFKGKIVILDFWGTTCGPCQEPMADSQTLLKDNPAWKDKVAIIPLSIDDTIDVVKKHVNQRGWTNTFNVWAGPGDCNSAPAKAYRVTGIPRTFIIDAHGKIIASFHPMHDVIVRTVENELKK